MENLNIGITIMVIGMSGVFVFLAIMIVVINITTKVIQIINKYFPEPNLNEANVQKKKQDDKSEIAVAIAAAIRERAKVQ